MQQLNLECLTHPHFNVHEAAVERVPEAQYAYYRRCQIFRKGGEQCKAPAEKGSLICHAHAAQTEMAVRRERERRAVLEEAVAEMRRRGKPEFEMRDLFMDFEGIQVTLAVMAQALIDGSVDCKTAGRLVVNLQTLSKLLWIYHREHREAQRENSLTTITTKKALTTKATKEHEGESEMRREQGRLAIVDRAKVQKVLGESLDSRNAETANFGLVKRTMEVNAGMRTIQGSWEEARAA